MKVLAQRQHRYVALVELSTRLPLASDLIMLRMCIVPVCYQRLQMHRTCTYLPLYGANDAARNNTHESKASCFTPDAIAAHSYRKRLCLFRMCE